MTLPNIHKTQKQRVCNTCMSHIVNETEAPVRQGFCVHIAPRSTESDVKLDMVPLT